MAASKLKPARKAKNNGGRTKQSVTPPDIDINNLPAPPPERSKKIPIELLIDLKEKGLSHAQIGKVVKCSPQNITQRLQAEGLETLAEYKENKDAVFEHLQQKIIKSIADEDIKKAPFGSRVTAAAILEDKIRLVRGQSTENKSVLVAELKSAQEGLNRLRGLKAKLIDHNI